LRSLLTAGAIMLGVGMVFGVLLLVGTIHSTFGRLYDGIYGKTDIVVSGEQSIGSLPGRRSTCAGGSRRRRRVGTVFSVFRTVDAGGHVKRGQMDQVFVSGVDFDQPDMTSAEHVAGRDPIRVAWRSSFRATGRASMGSPSAIASRCRRPAASSGCGSRVSSRSRAASTSAATAWPRWRWPTRAR
jgi:hypothetical protein